MATASLYSPSHSTNVLGALTFSFYVLSAFVLTLYITISLLRTYNTVSRSSSVQHARIQLFATLATISFATLSYNMLHFLINSYQAWAMQQPHPISIPRRGSSLGETAVNAPRMVDVWQWLESSMLFHDFAYEALRSEARSWWTVNALCVSINWAVTMSIEGRKRQIPQLWVYAAIAQILPVSFAQNLFYVAISLSPPSSPSALSKSSENSSSSEKLSSSSKSPIASNAKSENVGQMALFLLYYVLVASALGVATSPKYGSLLLLLVGVIRALLIAPLLFPVATPPGAESMSWPVAKTLTTGSALVFGYQSFAALRSNNWDVVNVLMAVRDNPAVAALGWDWLYSKGSDGAWVWMEGMTKM